MSEYRPNIRTGRLGLTGLLTIIFVILKLNPGGYLTTSVMEWPWIGWGISVLCPIIFTLYIAISIMLVLFILAVVAECTR